MPKKERIIEPINDSFENVVNSIIKTPNIERIKMTENDFRIHESDLTIPALRIANSKQGGFITTKELISHLERMFNVSGEDAEILEGRSDTKFSQIVRNIISHRESSKNMIARGFAQYDADKKGIQITIEGRKLLEYIIG